MRILITGGLGFIGSHLVDALVDHHDVLVVDDLSTGMIENKNEKALYLIQPIQQFCDSIENSNQTFDVVFHFANNARIARSFEFCEDTLLNNFASTIKLCEFIKRTNKDCKLIFASSSTTEFADKFNNPYTFSKISCDDVLELYRIHFNLNYSIVKFYNAYGSDRERILGEYTTIIRKFKDLYARNQPLVIYGDGSQQRDFTHIDDTISALLNILELQNDNGVTYHIGTGSAVKILDIAEAFNTEYKIEPARNYEVPFVVCKQPNVPNWNAEQKLINHIKEWIKNASS